MTNEQQHAINNRWWTRYSFGLLGIHASGYGIARLNALIFLFRHLKVPLCWEVFPFVSPCCLPSASSSGVDRSAATFRLFTWRIVAVVAMSSFYFKFPNSEKQKKKIILWYYRFFFFLKLIRRRPSTSFFSCSTVRVGPFFRNGALQVLAGLSPRSISNCVVIIIYRWAASFD